MERKFDRGYQVGESREEVVRGDCDVVVMATDEVARWILRQGEGKWWGAVQAIGRMTEETWVSFIAGCRSRGEMEDDDATVVIVRPTVQRSGVWVAVTPPHGVAVVQERMQALAQARREGDKERVAILYGDGMDCKRARVPREEIADAREVADAINEVRQAYWSALSRAGAGVRMQSERMREAEETRIRQAWLTHEALLQRSENRESVEKLLTMLHANSMLSEIVLPQAPSGPSTAPDEEPHAWFVLWVNRMIRALLALANIRDPRSGGGNASW